MSFSQVISVSSTSMGRSTCVGESELAVESPRPFVGNADLDPEQVRTVLRRCCFDCAYQMACHPLALEVSAHLNVLHFRGFEKAR